MGTEAMQSTCMVLFPEEAFEVAECFMSFPYKQFIEFLIIPHIATLLISEDRTCSPDLAYAEMMLSADYGDAFHCDVDDAVLSDIHHGNLKFLRKQEKLVKACLLFDRFGVSDTTLFVFYQDKLRIARTAAEVQAQVESKAPAAAVCPVLVVLDSNPRLTGFFTRT